MKIETDRRIEDVLADQGVLSPGAVSRLKVEAVNSGRSVEDLFLSQKLVTEIEYTKAKAELLKIPYVSLEEVVVPYEALLLVPETIARRYSFIPFEINSQEKNLSLAMADPLDLQVLEFVEKKTGYKVKPFIALPSKILKVINEQYSQNLTSEVSEALKETTGVLEGENALKNLESAEEVIREAPVAKIVSTLIEYGLKGRASDIHIEPQENKTRIRFRIDGVLQERLVIPKKVHDQLTSRVKILSNMKIDERRVPQDGRFTFKLLETVVDLRISSLPTVYGEKIVMRLLPKSYDAPTLSNLGLRGSALKTLEQFSSRPHGIILITGPTGSGKTTTLFSVLSKLNTSRVNIITIEDPIEYEIPGVNQVQVNPSAGLTFASGLRSILRQDPNIIMVGEIRDRETTSLAIQSSLTGHLVFSTLHTNNAAGALPRLLDMGAETFLLSSTLACVVGQRVVRTICPSCKESYKPSETILEDMQKVLGRLVKCTEKECNYISKTEDGKEHTHKILLFRGKGCRECTESGYRGRTGIFEVLPVDDKVGKMILERASTVDIENTAHENGMISMVQDGYLKVIEGITTIEEVLRVAYE